MQVGIVRFPGSNCDDDAYHAVTRVLGQAGRFVWHKDRELGPVDAVILPGGFSFGDYLRSGAMAAHSPIMGAVKEFAERGGRVLAVCNGFQIACEAGLLEGALSGNATTKFECRDVYLRGEGKIASGQVLKVPIAHHDGRYVHPDVPRLEAAGLVAFRYVDADGRQTAAANPNGSVADIAGVTNARGNVLGLMPHPERAVDALLGSGSEDGRTILEAFLR